MKVKSLSMSWKAPSKYATVKKCHLIKAGDSIYYDSIVPHHVHGYQGQAAKILAVIYTPI